MPCRIDAYFQNTTPTILFPRVHKRSKWRAALVEQGDLLTRRGEFHCQCPHHRQTPPPRPSTGNSPRRGSTCPCWRNWIRGWWCRCRPPGWSRYSWCNWGRSQDGQDSSPCLRSPSVDWGHTLHTPGVSHLHFMVTCVFRIKQLRKYCGNSDKHINAVFQWLRCNICVNVKHNLSRISHNQSCTCSKKFIRQLEPGSGGVVVGDKANLCGRVESHLFGKTVSTIRLWMKWVDKCGCCVLPNVVDLHVKRRSGNLSASFDFHCSWEQSSLTATHKSQYQKQKQITFSSTSWDISWIQTISAPTWANSLFQNHCFVAAVAVAASAFLVLLLIFLHLNIFVPRILMAI